MLRAGDSTCSLSAVGDLSYGRERGSWDRAQGAIPHAWRGLFSHCGQGPASSQDQSQSPPQLRPCFLSCTGYARRSSTVTLPFFSLVYPNVIPASLVSGNIFGHGDIFPF